jgi:hypothetical protein
MKSGSSGLVQYGTEILKLLNGDGSFGKDRWLRLMVVLLGVLDVEQQAADLHSVPRMQVIQDQCRS